MKQHRWGELLERLRQLSLKRGYVTADDVRRMCKSTSRYAHTLLADYARAGRATRLSPGKYIIAARQKVARDAILAMIADGSSVSADDVIKRYGIKYNTAYATLGRMYRKGEIARVGEGRYGKHSAPLNQWQLFQARRKELFETCSSAEEYGVSLQALEVEMGMQTLTRAR